MTTLAKELNRLAGTSGLDAAGAANVWAGTTGLALPGALYAKAVALGKTVPLHADTQGILNIIAGTTGVGVGTVLVNVTNSTVPTITSANTGTSTVGSAFTFTVTTTGTPTPSITKSAGSFPTGISLTDNGNGTATISGTPAAGTGGSYAVTLTATNSAGPANQSYTLATQDTPSVRSSSTVGTTTTAGSSTLTLPSGIQTGDLILIFASTKLGSSTTWTTPSGYSIEDSFAGTNNSAIVYYKVSANGATDSSASVTIDPSGTAGEATVAVVVKVNTFNSANPFDQSAGTWYIQGSSTSSVLTKSVTTNHVNSLVLIAPIQANGTTTTQTLTTPGGWSSVNSQFGHNGTTGILCQVYSQVQASPGSTAAPTVSSTVSNNYGPCYTMAIRGAGT